jgi:hypothetical protein
MIRRHLASWLARAAVRRLPRSRTEWAEALLAEVDHVDDAHVLRWALGYLLVTMKERLRAMHHEMTARQARRLNIAGSAGVALIALVVSYVMPHSPQLMTVLVALTVLWIVPFGYLSERETRACRRARLAAKP